MNMALQSMLLDPNAASYTDDQIVGKINSASAQITRAGSVSSAARPLSAGEAKTNLDAMADVDRGYIKTNPAAGEFKIISIERDANGKAKVDYDDGV